MTQENTQLEAYNRPENKLARVSMDELRELGEVFHVSGLFSDIESAAQAMIKVMAGQEYGFEPITSMSNVHIINGKPVLSAQAQASLIKSSGKYDFEVLELTPFRCKLQLYKRNGSGEFEKLAVEEFSYDDAERAGITKRWDARKNKLEDAVTWKKHPRNMLFARTVTNAMRFYFSDLLRGEIGDPDSIRFAEYEDLPNEPEIVEGEAVDTPEEPQEEAIDGEVVDEPAESAQEEESLTESVKQDDPPVDPEEAARAELFEAVQEKLIDLTGGDEKELNRLLKGRDPVQMPNEALSKLLIEITA